MKFKKFQFFSFTFRSYHDPGHLEAVSPHNSVSLKVVGNENGGGSGVLQMFGTMSRTMAIDIYLPFEHTGFVYKSKFRFRLL